MNLKQNSMTKVFIINGGQKFAHSGGAFNETITGWTSEFLQEKSFEFRKTDVIDPYDPMQEVENFKWADIIIYHTPIWWFQLPYRLKQYIDEVFTAGHQNGMYTSDGRSRNNPAINYGTGGLMHGKKYMVTTSWNAPDTAFTLPGEFFNQTSVDDGILFGFHHMNAFTGMKKLDSFHFHDMEKSATLTRIENYRVQYSTHLERELGSKLQPMFTHHEHQNHL
jgi:modulator of drug activity B